MAQAPAPRDIVEWFRGKDIVDNAWESARLRRMRAGMVAFECRHGLGALLRLLRVEAFEDAGGGKVPAEAVAQAYVEGDPIWGGLVNRVLAARGLGPETIDARALGASLRRIEPLDRMIAASDERRDMVLREVGRKGGVAVEAVGGRDGERGSGRRGGRGLAALSAKAGRVASRSEVGWGVGRCCVHVEFDTKTKG